METYLNTTTLNVCGELLIKKKLTIAFVESATGGRIASEFSLVTDAGNFLKGGIVCYDAKLKETLLGVPHQQIQTFSPESEIVTRSITSGLQKLIPADIYIGCTGLTSPGGSETDEKPVGTMFLCGIKAQDLLFNDRNIYKGDSEQIILQTIERAAQLLYHHLMKDA